MSPTRLKREFPNSNAQIGAAVIPVKEDALGNVGLELIVLLAASGCVLLRACATHRQPAAVEGNEPAERDGRPRGHRR